MGDRGDLYTFRLLRTPSALRRLAYLLIVLFVIVLGSMFLPWQQNIQGQGEVTALLPQDRPQRVVSALSGMIAEWYVREGQFVKEGEKLARITEIKDKYFDPEMLQRLRRRIEVQKSEIADLKNKEQALQEQYQALQEGQDLSMQKARNKLQQTRYKFRTDSVAYQVAQRNLAIAEQRLERQQKLYEKGLKSLNDVESRQLKKQEQQAKTNEKENKLAETRQELVNARLQVSSTRVEYNEKLAKTSSNLNDTRAKINAKEGKLAQLQNKYSNMKVRDSMRTIRAPQTGYIVRALKQGVGEAVKSGERLMRIVPDDPELAAEIYVKDTDVPLIHEGDPVRLQFDGWPALQVSGWPSVAVGTFGGEVTMVDRVNARADEYRVLITPSEDSEPWPEQLRMGSGVYGWAMLREVPIWYELWRQLNGFPPSRSSAPGSKGGNKVDGKMRSGSKAAKPSK
jgi:multidrug resistance efflux pump